MMTRSKVQQPPPTHRIEVRDLKPAITAALGQSSQQSSETSSVSGDDEEVIERRPERVQVVVSLPSKMESSSNGPVNGINGTHQQQDQPMLNGNRPQEPPPVSNHQLAAQLADLKGCFTHLSHQIAQVMAILRVPPCPCSGCVARSGAGPSPMMVAQRRPTVAQIPVGVQSQQLSSHGPPQPLQPGINRQPPLTPQSAPPMRPHPENGLNVFSPPKSAGPMSQQGATAIVNMSSGENETANALLNQLFNHPQDNGGAVPNMAAAFTNGNGHAQQPPNGQYGQQPGGGKMKIDRRAVAEYAQIHGAIAAARKFGIPPPVATFYQRKEGKPDLSGINNIAHTSGSPGFLRGRGRGRPKLIGDELDADLVEYMVTVKQSDPSGHLTASQALVIAKDYILEKAPGLLEEHGGHVKLKLTWAMKLVSRIAERQREIELGLPAGALSNMQRNLAQPGGNFMADMMAQNLLQPLLGTLAQGGGSSGSHETDSTAGDSIPDTSMNEGIEESFGVTATPEIVNVKELHLPFGVDGDDEIAGAIDDEEVRFDEGLESSESS